MSNDFYNAGGAPTPHAQGASAAIRGEFANIALGFDKFPTLTGNALKLLRINSSGTGLESISLATLNSNYLLLTGGTMLGTLTTVASSTTAAGVNLPHGTAPTAPVDGDLWTTTTGLVGRVNGATRTMAMRETANTFTAGAKQTTSHTSTTAGFRVIPIAGDPSTLVDGDIWFNLTNGKFNIRQSSATKTLIYESSNNSLLTNDSAFITSSASITGNAATATKLAATKNINGVAFDGSADITVADATKLPTAGGTMVGLLTTVASATGTAGFRLPHGAAPTTPTNGDVWSTTAGLFARINAATKTVIISGSNISLLTNDSAFITSSASITGNAATATALASAVLINGVSFDGSGNITVADSTKLPTAGGTMTGLLTTKASVAGSAGFNVPAGTAPTTPTNGDLWATSAGLFARVAGATKTIAFTDSALTGTAAAATVLSPGANINGTLFTGGSNITVADATKLPLTGGTLSGALTVNAAATFTGAHSIQRSGAATQSIDTINDGSANTLKSLSGTSNAKPLRIFATTDASDTTPSSGSVSIIFGVLGTTVGTWTNLEASFALPLKQGSNQVWHAGNLDPTTYAPLGGATMTGNLFAPSVIATNNLIGRGGASEGGQLVLGYGGGAATSITAQANSTWNLDVFSDNSFRLFRQGSTGTIVNVFSAAESTGAVTFSGLVSTVASATGGAGLRVPHGAAPTTPTNGDLWTTTTGAFARINAATKTFLFSGDTLDADDLGAGTIPTARFPSTLPALNGSLLTNLDASDLASGTVPDARFPSTLPALNGSALTALNATNLASGTVAAARLPSTMSATTFSGLVATAASATGGAGFRLPHGAAPTTPTNGDVWTTTSGAFARINAATKTFLFSGDSLDAGDLTNPLPALSGASLTSLNASNLASGTVPAGRISGSVAYDMSAATVNGEQIGYRGVPRSTSYVAGAATIRSGCYAMTAGMTIASTDGWVAGDITTLYNNSASAITIASSGMTLRLAGTTTTGSRTIAARGIMTIWFNTATEGICSGAGVT